MTAPMHPSDALPSELAAFEAWYVDRFKKPLPADYAGMCDWGTWQAAWRARLAAPTQAAPAAADHVEDEVCNEPCGICDDAAPAAAAVAGGEAIAEIHVGGVPTFGRAAVLNRWLPGAEQLPDGTHRLYAAKCPYCRPASDDAKAAQMLSALESAETYLSLYGHTAVDVLAKVRAAIAASKETK